MRRLILLLALCLVADQAHAFAPSIGRIPTTRQCFSSTSRNIASLNVAAGLPRARHVQSLRMVTGLAVNPDTAWKNAESGDLGMLKSILLGNTGITLLRPDPLGDAVQLSEIIKGKNKALICFMRHVGEHRSFLLQGPSIFVSLFADKILFLRRMTFLLGAGGRHQRGVAPAPGCWRRDSRRRSGLSYQGSRFHRCPGKTRSSLKPFPGLQGPCNVVPLECDERQKLVVYSNLMG
jgi:hypothetical protein